MTIIKNIIKSPFLWGALLAGCALFYFSNSFKIQKTEKIEKTTTDITSIKEIAEWEFLTIKREEFLDTTLKSGAKLARIYTGTLRLGLNMKHAKQEWVNCKNDTANLELPAIELLDRDFIDEANVRTFYESGKINASLKEKMYEDAKLKMKENALTPENIRIAEENAKTQFSLLFKSLGFSTIHITMEECIE